jgi:uncharacterized protein (TIGR01319 family)
MTTTKSRRRHPDALFLCVDFGSTWTKAHLVTATGELLGFTMHPTTVGTDVMKGFHSCRNELAQIDARVMDAEVLACSSAGGGLRIAVVGTELLVTAEAGQRVAMSSGGRIVHVAAGSEWSDEELESTEPDLVLLVGGTDGGNTDVVLENARRLAHLERRTPVVIACNVDAQVDAERLLKAAGRLVTVAPNVLPAIGQLNPDGARAAIRNAFLAHVIGGKGLSRDPMFGEIVRGATPDIVLLAVELLSRGHDGFSSGVGEVAVVDIGGATTDIYSVVVVDAEDADLSKEVVAVSPASRTVEGDLGMRWSAVSTVSAAADAAFIDSREQQIVGAAAEVLERDPSQLPRTKAAKGVDDWLASLGIGLGFRRHAGRSRVEIGEDGRVVERTGKDLRTISTLIASGGAVRHSADPYMTVTRYLSSEGRWQLPEGPAVVVDVQAVLSVAGLLSLERPETAFRLMSREIRIPSPRAGAVMRN